MKLKNFFIVIVTTLNIYYFLLWLYIFNENTNQKDRVNAFLENWSIINNINILDFILVILTFASLFISFYKFKSKVKIISIIINILFLLFIIWSRL